jgi:AcrR family transcriptional regulator
VYSNFASKEELFFAVYERRLDKRVAQPDRLGEEAPSAHAALRAAVDTAGRRSEDGWMAVFFEFWAHVLRHPGVPRAVRGAASSWVHPTQFSLVAGDPAVREFQVRQRGPRILLRLALRDDAAVEAPDRIVRAVTERLSTLGVERPAVAAEVTESIERTPAGKLAMVVPDRAAGVPHESLLGD